MADSVEGAAKAVSDLALGSASATVDAADSAAPGSEETISKK